MTETRTETQPAIRRNPLSTLFVRLTHSPIWPVLVLAYVAVVTYQVTEAPRSLFWRLLFLTGLLLIFAMPQRLWLKLTYAGVVALILVPLIGISNPFFLELGFQICAFATLALGLNIVVGFAGLLDLGYIAFYAVGAYAWAFFGSQQLWNLHTVAGTAQAHVGFPLNPNWFWVFLILGTCAAAFMGIALGTPVLRLRGDYLAIVTLGFGEVIRVLASNLSKPINLTNGPQGITPIQRPDLPLVLISPEFLGTLTEFAGRVIGLGDIYAFFFYLLALAILVVTITIARRLENSKLGRAWTAIREDEVAAIAMGIPLVKSKLAAFAIGASFSGAMGVVFAANRTFVSPETFSLTSSISVLVMVILGGLGSIPGAVVGAAVVTLLNIDFLQTLSLELSRLRQGAELMPIIGIPWSELPSQLDPARYQRLVFGVILVLMMIFRPEGIIPSQRRKLEIHEHEEG
ncbi:MAG: branched-chain amino acid ABC transporter permease [Caldilineaceae bacterium]|nr:branched-chain amino acid ABC transporter permease [Caldilineaceae bacterium]